MASSEWSVQMWLNFQIRAVFRGTAKLPFNRPATTTPAQLNIRFVLSSQPRRNPRDILVKHFVVILGADAGNDGGNEGPKTYLAAGELSRYLRHQSHGNGNHCQRGTCGHRDPVHIDQGI